MKKIVVFIAILSSLPSCVELQSQKCEEIYISDYESFVYSNCIQYIIKSKSFKEVEELGNSSTYIVQPYFDNFSLSVFSNRDVNNFLLNHFKAKSNIAEIEDSFNGKYTGKCCLEFAKFSSCGESPIIISFTGIYDNLLIANLRLNSKIVRQEEVTIDSNLEGDIWLSWFFLLKINKEGFVVGAIEDSVQF